jgi:HPt (histidine-containing phosphotransfer) domain-containing protein
VFFLRAQRNLEPDMDLSIALAHVEGDLQLLAELAAMFVGDYPRFLEETHEAILRNDYATLEREAHTLKGRLAFFGILPLREKALELEMMGRNQDLSRAPQLLRELDAEMKSILPQFESLAREQTS